MSHDLVIRKQVPQSTVSLVKISKHAGEEISASEFMSRIFKRIMGIPHSHHRERTRLRSELVELLRRLEVRPYAQPPYNQVAAGDIRDWLGCFQEQTDYDLSTDFEALLATVERRARLHKERVQEEMRKAAAARTAEMNRDKEGGMEDWNVVDQKEADEEWEMV